VQTGRPENVTAAAPSRVGAGCRPENNVTARQRRRAGRGNGTLQSMHACHGSDATAGAHGPVTPPSPSPFGALEDEPSPDPFSN
jgi:hypothetical protein